MDKRVYEVAKVKVADPKFKDAAYIIHGSEKYVVIRNDNTFLDLTAGSVVKLEESKNGLKAKYENCWYAVCKLESYIYNYMIQPKQ